MRGYKVSERVRFSVYPGAHGDAGEIWLIVEEEHAKSDRRASPPSGLAPEDDTNRKLEELEKVREKLRHSEGK